mmetsp:Transcript_1234/g.2676  ORF Transcript_1234/g.2676 Transcript_1234/m.2676 type:complete len:211 (+) Transcript_1234:352-984(+)
MAPWIMPPMATIASLPFLSSFSLISSCLAGSLGNSPSGSKPKSPGALSNSFMLLSAARVMTSARLIHRRICFMEVSRRASCASRTLGMASKENCSPGTRTNSGTTRPTVASMAWRPCLSSASRNQLSHSGDRSAKPTGSKSFELLSPPHRKGMGSGPSPPTMPLANSARPVVVRAVGTGAKAAAAPAVAARMADANLAMVELLLTRGVLR